MKLRNVAFSNLRRRKGRSAFLVAGLLLGIGTVVTLLTLSSALTVQAQNNLETFGANIVVAPRSDGLSLSYGGVSLGGVSVGSRDIREADLARIATIPNRRNIAVVAPELLGVVPVKGRQALLMGVRPAEEFKLKQWWSVDGRPPRNGHELVAGSSAAAALHLAVGDRVSAGRPAVHGHRHPAARPAPRTTICSSPTSPPPRRSSASRARSRWSRWRRSAATAPWRRSSGSSASPFPAPRSRRCRRRSRTACTPSTSSAPSATSSPASSSPSRRWSCSSP